MELQPCKIAAAAALILLLLTIGGVQGLQAASAGGECSAVSRSRTFEGDCGSNTACVAACTREGYTGGYCFTDVDGPDHRVCMCTAPCPPATAKKGSFS